MNAHVHQAILPRSRRHAPQPARRESAQPDPGEAPDLTAVIAGLNRLYELALRGSQTTGGQNPITYDLPDTAFWGMTEASNGTPRSIVTVTDGDTDFLDRVKDVPFYQQVFGPSKGWSFVAPPHGNQDNYSLAGTV